MRPRRQRLRTPASNAKIIKMAAARPRLRPRGKLRNVRWNVQWWAALTSVLAGLMSIPAFVISINALALSEQQRAGALAQRAEDQRKEAQAKAEAEAVARDAFPSCVQVIAEPFGTILGATSWHVRNANSQRAYVYVVHLPNNSRSSLWEFAVESCSEGTIVIPESKTQLDELGGEQDVAVANAYPIAVEEARVWRIATATTKPVPISDFEEWMGLDTWPDDVVMPTHQGALKRARLGIMPCT